LLLSRVHARRQTVPPYQRDTSNMAYHRQKNVAVWLENRHVDYDNRSTSYRLQELYGETVWRMMPSGRHDRYSKFAVLYRVTRTQCVSANEMNGNRDRIRHVGNAHCVGN